MHLGWWWWWFKGGRRGSCSDRTGAEQAGRAQEIPAGRYRTSAASGWLIRHGARSVESQSGRCRGVGREERAEVSEDEGTPWWATARNRIEDDVRGSKRELCTASLQQELYQCAEPSRAGHEPQHPESLVPLPGDRHSVTVSSTGIPANSHLTRSMLLCLEVTKILGGRRRYTKSSSGSFDSGSYSWRFQQEMELGLDSGGCVNGSA